MKDMMIKLENAKIIKAGNPSLGKVSEPVPEHLFGSNEIKSLSQTMLQVMRDEPGVGLAAPQIGINLRVFVLGVKNDPRLDNGVDIPDTTIINPTIEFFSSDTISDYEGCLSVGDIRAKVPRAKRIIFSGFDMDGTPFRREASGFEARIIQHEYDHLNGIIFLERVKDKKSFILKEEFKKL